MEDGYICTRYCIYKHTANNLDVNQFYMKEKRPLGFLSLVHHHLPSSLLLNKLYTLNVSMVQCSVKQMQEGSMVVGSNDMVNNLGIVAGHAEL